jgi:uncharacterized protein (TIGR02285 family)
MKIFSIFICTFIFQTLFAQEIEIVFEERIPYIQKNDLSISGLVATPAIKALNASKINYILKEKPSKRHLYEIQANQKPICALGWFKNSEREQFAKFTLPLYQDYSMGIIARKDRKKDFFNISIDDLLKNNDKILTKASYSYGKFLDDKLEQYKITKKEVYSDNENMLLLIERKRADFMFISKEESTLLFEKNQYKDISFYDVKGMPEGNKRYLICSKKVDDDIINQINQYLK